MICAGFIGAAKELLCVRFEALFLRLAKTINVVRFLSRKNQRNILKNKETKQAAFGPGVHANFP
jgi:hypothetical protein